MTAVGVVVTAAFVMVERRASTPLVAPEARHSPHLRWGAFGSFFNTATTSSSITVATLYLQDDLGRTSLETAALLVGCSLLAVVGSAGAPRSIVAVGRSRALGYGLGIVAGGNTLMFAWPQVAGVGTGAGLCGLGIGIGSVAATDMGTTVGDAIKSTAAGVLNTAAQLGTAIGTALVLPIATNTQPRLAWAVIAVLAGLAGTAATVGAPRRTRSHRGAPTGPSTTDGQRRAQR